MAIGTLLGVSTGVCLGMWRRGRRAAFLSVEVFRAIPAIALIPLSMLLLGFGMGMEISIAAFATFWPSLIFTTAAVLQIDHQLFELSALLRLGPLQRCLKIILPAIVPRLLLAMRFAIGMALIASVTVEIVANPFGMGFAMMFAQQSLNPSLMQAWLLWIGLLGYAIHLATIRLETALARRMGAII
ncbi:ABC transporter permease [Paraburkholderia sp. RL17-347-BIC-D]|uniref:ABC transporter permease n=1 Tax=Paraburkholderia sp. RL17-347-BIC-D TaxID=3031632 RepID=UPI0038BC3DA6